MECLMWKRLSDSISRVSNGWVALSATLIFLLFTLLVLPDQASRAEANTGDAGSPDMSFYYSADDLYELAKVYGEEGRRAYVRARFTFDLIWPLVYTVFLSAGISWVNRRAFGLESLWQRANLVPALAALFDYLENMSTSLVMIRYPSATPVVDAMATVFTMVKWVLVSSSFVILLAGIVFGARQWVRERTTR
jgi:hypothetical protein